MAAQMARPRPRLAVAAAGALALALVVGGALAARGGQPPAVRPNDGRIAIAMRDFRFEPQRVRARAGNLTFELHNRGRLAHTFRVLGKEGEVIAEPSLRPGERRTVTKRLKRGRYRIFDALSNYEELGMYGSLVVR